MTSRTTILVVAVWLLGAAWVMVPHPLEGDVVWVINERYKMGIHASDPLGVVVPICFWAWIWNSSR